MMIPETTLVWHQGMTNWQPICDISNQLNLSPFVLNDLLKYDEISKKIRQAETICSLITQGYARSRDEFYETMYKIFHPNYLHIYSAEKDYFCIIHAETYKDNPNPFAIYMLPMALQCKGNVKMEDILLTKKFIEIISIQLNYPAVSMDLFYCYHIRVHPFEKKGFSFFRDKQEKEAYHLYKELHKVLDNFLQQTMLICNYLLD